MRTNLRHWHWMVKADWKRWIRWCITLARLMTWYHVGDCCTVWWLSGSSIVASSTRQRRSWLASTKLCRCSGCSTSMNESSRFSLDSCCCWVVLGLYCPHARHRYGPFLHVAHSVVSVHFTFFLVHWHCWFGIRKSIWPVKIQLWGVGVVICLERDADCLHMVQLMPLHPKTP